MGVPVISRVSLNIDIYTYTYVYMRMVRCICMCISIYVYIDRCVQALPTFLSEPPNEPQKLEELKFEECLGAKGWPCKKAGHTSMYIADDFKYCADVCKCGLSP